MCGFLQRLQAALDFDTSQLELPAIRESSVSNDILTGATRTIAPPQWGAGSHIWDREAAMRREWMQFMSASKVGSCSSMGCWSMDKAKLQAWVCCRWHPVAPRGH